MDDPRETDLFGHPVRPRKGERGRPRKMLTAEDLDMLEAAQTMGVAPREIAKTLGIGYSTLKRNFGPLLTAAARKPTLLKLALRAKVTREALAGNMAAARLLRQMIQEDELVSAEARVARDVDGDAGRRNLGKKELSEIDAEEAELSLTAEIEAEARDLLN